MEISPPGKFVGKKFDILCKMILTLKNTAVLYSYPSRVQILFIMWSWPHILIELSSQHVKYANGNIRNINPQVTIYTAFNLHSSGILSNSTHTRSIISISLHWPRSPMKPLSPCTPTWQQFSFSFVFLTVIRSHKKRLHRWFLNGWGQPPLEGKPRPSERWQYSQSVKCTKTQTPFFVLHMTNTEELGNEATIVCKFAAVLA